MKRTRNASWTSWSSSWSDSYNETVDYPGFYEGAYYGDSGYSGSGSGDYLAYLGDAFGSSSGSGSASGGGSGGLFSLAASTGQESTLLAAERQDPTPGDTADRGAGRRQHGRDRRRNGERLPLRDRFHAGGGPSPWHNASPVWKRPEASNAVVVMGADAPEEDGGGADDQALLDYYRRIMQLMILVGDALWRGGVDELNREMPWFSVAEDTSEIPGYTGNLHTQMNPYAPQVFFPKTWCRLMAAMVYSQQNYSRIGFFEVDMTPFADRNYGWFPGIAISRESFEGKETGAIRALVHEPLHDMGRGFLWLGLGHRHIDPIVAAEGGEDDYTRFIDFLQNTRLRDGRSLWDAILDQAGPRPGE